MRLIEHTPHPGGRSSLLARALAAIDYAVFERRPDGEFRLHGDPPAWIVGTPDVERGGLIAGSEFLRHFVDTVAGDHWSGLERRTENAATSVSSGIWSEPRATGDPIYLEAIAVADPAGRDLLLVRRLGSDYDILHALAQRANETALEHQRLSSDVQKKDVLLQCIVHDLASPLSAILLSLRHLMTSGDPESRGLAEIALREARRQRGLIQSVSELFSSDLSQFTSSGTATETGGDLVAVARLVTEAHAVEARRRAVTIELEDETDTALQSAEYRAEAASFQRVVGNLVRNALRFAPAGSSIEVRLGGGDETLRLTVEDRGPGVEPDLVGTLFNPFSQGRRNRGHLGLGLYYCHITVERWGGSIRYSPGAGGGATFVVDLAPAT